jgi:glycosyltransferase involved in cell wall biosynthesis
MNNPNARDACKISVIVLAKNCEKFLLECVGSILSSGTVEIIIVDPGSVDRTRSLINFLREVYPEQIRLVDKIDHSPAEGLNNGLELVSGNVIGILNGDDMYLPGTLRFVENYFNSNSALDILLMGGIVSNESTWKSKLIYPSEISSRRLAVSKFGSITFFHQGMFVSRSFASSTKYNPENKVSWDFEYLADLVLRNPTIEIVKNQAAIFRIHPGSISGSKMRLKEAQENNYRIAVKLLNRNLNFLDFFVGTYFRLEKFVKSSLASIADTVFYRNRI